MRLKRPAVSYYWLVLLINACQYHLSTYHNAMSLYNISKYGLLQVLCG